jgi:hypothetical protein
MGADMTKGSLTKNGGETNSSKEMVDLYHLLIEETPGSHLHGLLLK